MNAFDLLKAPPTMNLRSGGMETIQGNIQRVVSVKENGWRCLKVRMTSGPIVTVTGEFGPEMVVGTIADFHGRHITNKYGPSFKVSSYSITHDANEMASFKLFLDDAAPKIGPERAENICAHFGRKLFDILNDEPDRLLEVDGIGKVSVESIKQAWAKRKGDWDKLRAEFTLRAFLNALGIKERRVKKVIGHFGGGFLAEQNIRQNPYLLADIEGFGFSTADFVARKLGTPEDSPDRAKAFALHVLESICPVNGHLYLTRQELTKAANQYAVENNTRFLGKRALCDEDFDPAVKALLEGGKVILDGNALYVSRVYSYEAESAFMLKEIMEAKSDLDMCSMDAVDKHIDTYEFVSGMTLSEQQKTALHHFVEKKVFVITGAPGTGKTQVLKVVVDLVLKTKLSLVCMTPTGISAKRMASTINFEASTIHRKLGFRGDNWMYGQDNKLDVDVVIIDETSMVDQEVFFRLLSALRTRTHLILVGDDNQLPSVGPGNVLRELINCGAVPVVRLTQIFRQDEASDIIKAAHSIKDGNTDLTLFKSDPKSDVYFIRQVDTATIEGWVVAFARRFKAEKRQFQILTPRNDGPLSVKVLNKVLQEALNPAQEGLAELPCRDYVLRVGDRVRVKKNDYQNSIYNGDVGKVVEIKGGYVAIEISSGEAPKEGEPENFLSGGGHRVVLPVDELDQKIKLAYAISVHGSQGSEYKYVILPFINQFGRLILQRNLLYTGLTRAKEKVIMMGHESAVQRAISNATVDRRNTKLGERLCRNLGLTTSSSTPQPQEGQQGSQSDQSGMDPSLSLESALSLAEQTD